MPKECILVQLQHNAALFQTMCNTQLPLLDAHMQCNMLAHSALMYVHKHAANKSLRKCQCICCAALHIAAHANSQDNVNQLKEQQRQQSC
jgi:hypothetical protein